METCMNCRLIHFFLTLLFAWVIFSGNVSAVEAQAEPLPVGENRQLFLDDWLIQSMENVEIRVHQPTRREIAQVRDMPWEGSGCKFHSVIYDAQTGRYLMYSTAWQAENYENTWNPAIMNVTLSVSRDGIHWERPNLGFVLHNGSKQNNLLNVCGVLDFSPFIDQNPDAKPEERFKGISSNGHGAMSVWVSPDGVNWKPLNDGKPVYTPGTLNGFDSQNVAFWSITEKKYVVYYRARANWSTPRTAERAVSDDFVHWTKETMIQLPPEEALVPNRGEFYTNQIQPYYRAPQIYLGFPARYVDNGETRSFTYLPEQEERRTRMKIQKRFGTVTTDSIYIVSRDGVHFRKSNDVFLAPGLRTHSNWSYGDNYIAAGIVETAPTNSDEERELSIYAAESAFTGRDTICRRYTLRIDGFASLHAKTQVGVAVTRPFTFTGKELSLNFSTSAAGSLAVEICDADGKPIPGFMRTDCDILYGDTLDRRVTWRENSDVSRLSDRVVTLKFYMTEADVYSMKFEKE